MEGIVLYTDGGCRPNPGHGGYGIHGYLYTTDSKVKSSSPKGYKITDNGYIVSNKISDNDRLVYPIEYYDIAGSLSFKSTNTEAEIMSVIKGMEIINKHIDKITKISLHVDNQYVFDILSIFLGKLETDTINIKAHKELLNKLKHQTDTLRSKHISISINKIESHSNDFGNDIADILATIGVNISYTYNIENKQIDNISLSKGYWKSPAIIPSILKHKFMFFNTSDNNVPNPVYRTMNYDKDTSIGRAISTSTYITTVTDNIPLFDTIYTLQKEVLDKNSIYHIITLLTNLSIDIQKYHNMFGKYIFTITDTMEGKTISYLFKTQITKILSPLGLTFKIVDIYSMLDSVLKDKDNYTYIDITESITNDKWLNNNNKAISIKTPYGNYKLITGLNMPVKTILKKLKDQDRVYIVFLKDTSIEDRYKVMIETDSYIAVWLNYPSSLIVNNK